MRYANWLMVAGVGVSFGFLTAGGMSQERKAAQEGDIPRRVALDVSEDADAPPAKGFAAGSDPSKIAPRVQRQAERQDTRRIPVVDANANSTFRSTQLIGTNIADADGRMIGKVVDFVTDARGNIQYPIVSYSGSPGFTGKLFAVPLAGLRFSSGDNHATTAQFAFDPQLLKNAPSFSTLRFPDFSDRALINELKSFYSKLLPNTNTPIDSRATATDPTVPANGPGDRPARINPANPQAGEQPDVIGKTGSPAGSTLPGDSVVDRTGSPAGSVGPGGSLVGPSGSPAPGATATEGKTRSSAEREAVLGGGSLPADNRLMLRSSQMLGIPLQDDSGKSMGKVVDYVGDSTGNNQFAVVSMGSDGHNIVVPFNALNFQTGARGSNFARLRLAPEQLKNAPSFRGNEWPNFMDSKYRNGVSNFYSRFNYWNPDGTKYPVSVGPPRSPGTPPNPGAPKGPQIPARGSSARGVPGVPPLPGVPGRPGSVPSAPAAGGAPGGAGSGGGAKAK